MKNSKFNILIKILGGQSLNRILGIMLICFGVILILLALLIPSVSSDDEILFPGVVCVGLGILLLKYNELTIW